MRRYSAVRRYKCSCCQWGEDKSAARADQRQMIRKELQEYFESLEVENKVTLPAATSQQLS